MLALWHRLPVIVKAVLTGTLAATIGTVPWALLVAANQKVLPSIPWSVPVMAVYLFLLWRLAPRANLRANRLSDEVWGSAIVAGLLGLWALVITFQVVNRLVRLPQQQAGDLSMFPPATLAALLIMGSIVAGVVEESSFRGYMQGPIERRHGPLVAILVTGSLFGFAHFTHPEVGLLLLPYFMAVAAIYGTLTYLTNSIYPAMLLHAGGDVLVAFDYLARGQSEWRTSSKPAPLIWETGPDASFLLTAAGAVVISAAAIWAYRALAVVARNASA